MKIGSTFRDRHRPAREASAAAHGWRLWFVGATLTAGALALLGRAVYLQVIDQDFLARQGDARILRDVKLSANRGMVLDRNGEPLAVSTPVDTVWADPRKLAQSPQDFARLAKALDRDPQWLARRVTSSLDREFVYLVRHMRPQDADEVDGAARARRRHAARVSPLLPGRRGHRAPARLHQRRRRRARKGSSSRSTSGSAGSPA